MEGGGSVAPLDWLQRGSGRRREGSEESIGRPSARTNSVDLESEQRGGWDRLFQRSPLFSFLCLAAEKEESAQGR